MLEDAVRSLKNVYLTPIATNQQPTNEQQEMARAFIVFAHAEIEWYVERASLELNEKVLNAGKAGAFSASSLALLTFAGIDPVKGGDSLGVAKNPRTLSMRLGQACANHKKLAEENEGIREKHLAKLFVPLGLDADSVDSAWLGELEAFSSKRGALAHMSRSESRASPLAINPVDTWIQCERIVWGPRIQAPNRQVCSLADLDAWLLGSASQFASVYSKTTTPSLGSLLLAIWQSWRR